jgi:hypothetical protein
VSMIWKLSLVAWEEVDNAFPLCTYLAKQDFTKQGALEFQVSVVSALCVKWPSLQFVSLRCKYVPPRKVFCFPGPELASDSSHLCPILVGVQEPFKIT